jgi:hypothetical protein
MTALTLLSYLYLENHSVNEEDSNLHDSAMVLIKRTSEKETLHHNSFRRVNKMFVQFVIDYYIALSFLTDAYAVHMTGVSPAPYAKVEFSLEESTMFQHNQCLLIDYVLDSTRQHSVVAHYLRIKNSSVGWWITSKYEKIYLCWFTYLKLPLRIIVE